jgi:hypothetical protein
MPKMQSASSLLLALAVVLVSPVAGATEYRASYEVEVKGGEGSHSIRTAEALGDDGVLSQELGPYKVVLAPTFEGGDSYSLEVSVSFAPQTATDISPVTSQSFHGSLGGPLEFSGNFGGVLVTGAIMLHARGGAS